MKCFYLRRGYFLFWLREGSFCQRNPAVTLGEPAFFPTLEAHTDAPIVAGNRIDVLLNGDGTFPIMLRDVRSAKTTITFAQYLYEDGSIARIGRGLCRSSLPSGSESAYSAR